MLKNLKQYTQNKIQGLCEIFTIIQMFSQFNIHDITPSLSAFYTASKEKRKGTRQRHRPEFDYIFDAIQSMDKKDNLRILELGCGDGRFAEFLDKKFPGSFQYIGVDCSNGLIECAKERLYSNNVQFFMGDMLNYMSFLEQQSFDVIISIASIQHIHKSKRLILRNAMYSLLEYDGLCITTNRSFSLWILQKHRKSVLASLVLIIINSKVYGYGDLMIPFREPITSRSQSLMRSMPKLLKDKKSTDYRTSYRFYHFFSLLELRQYAQRSGFIVYFACYINNVGQLSDRIRQSRNSFIVAKKTVIQ